MNRYLFIAFLISAACIIRIWLHGLINGIGFVIRRVARSFLGPVRLQLSIGRPRGY